MNIPQTHNQNPNLPTTNDDYNPYIAFGDSVSQSNIVGHLLKFTKFGEFEAGENSINIPHGTELIAHMGDVLIGWQRWQDQRPTEQVMGLVRDNFQPPRRSELGDNDQSLWEVDDSGKSRDPWQKTTMVIFKGLDNDELYTFSTSSKGGIQAVGKLSKEYGKQMRMRPNQFPVVRLGWDSYEHSNKQYGEIRYPVFEIVGWADRDEIDKALAGMQGGAQEQLPLDPPAPQTAAPTQRSYREASSILRQLKDREQPQQRQPQQPSRQASQQPQQPQQPSRQQNPQTSPNRNTRF
jgi:hypothetical protein